MSATSEAFFKDGAEEQTIEACWHPASTAQKRDGRPVVGVVCHPHPLHGGTMDNKVVTTIARAWSQNGVPCLRFNFRGVGQSQGVFDHGNGESADLIAMVDEARARVHPEAQLLLAGFSFGAYVATLASARLKPMHLTLVAPPVGSEGYAFPQSLGNDFPVTVIQAQEDEIVNNQFMNAWCAEQSHLDIHPLPGGHFFHGRLAELRQRVIQQLTTAA